MLVGVKEQVLFWCFQNDFDVYLTFEFIVESQMGYYQLYERLLIVINQIFTWLYCIYKKKKKVILIQVEKLSNNN